MADCCLRDVQLRRGVGEAEVAGRGFKRAQTGEGGEPGAHHPNP